MNSEQNLPNLPKPHRLHPSSMLFEAIKLARDWGSAAVVPGLAALFGSGLSGWAISLILTGVVLLLLLSALWGFLSWRATTYSVSGGAFQLRRGVLQKSERTIPLDHVQSVDTVQGFLQRGLSEAGLLDVVEVKIETAGGGSREADASLSSVAREEADSLRRELGGAGNVPAEEEPGPTLIRRLLARELLVGGATSGQIGAAAAILAFASQYADDVVRRFFSERFVEGVVRSVAPHAFAAVALAVFAIGVFAWLLAIAGTVLAYSGFTLSRSADGRYLNIRRGLIRRYEATVPTSRIQAIRIVEGPLRQPFGLATLRVESAGYGAKREEAGVSTTLFPLISRKEVPDFLEEVAPEFVVRADLKPLPRRALRRYLFRSLLAPAVLVLVCGLALFSFGLLGTFRAYFAVAALALLILTALRGWAAFRAAGWAAVGDCFVVRYRNLSRTTAIIPRRRLQSRSIVRSPFQRRLDLATLRTRVASGTGGATFEVKDLESPVAEKLARRFGPRRSRPVEG